VAPQQADAQVVQPQASRPLHREGLPAQVRITLLPLPIPADHDQSRAGVMAYTLDDRHRLGFLRRADQRHAGLDDAGLLERDERQRMAQQLDMVVAQAGDARDRRVNDVGRIQPAAQPHFEHGPFDALLRKVLECQRGHYLERRDARRRLDDGLAALQQVDQLGLRHQPAVQADALAKGVQVRGGVQPRAIARSSQHRFDHRRRRAFALRARDVDAAEALMRPAQSFQDLLHPAEVEGDGVVRVARLFLVIDVTEDVLQGILVAAHSTLLSKPPL